MANSEGILYIATGKKYINEAVTSARSLEEHMPDIPISIISNREPDSDIFDTVFTVDNPSYSFKDNVDYLRKSPYDKTIFLDSDTYVCRDISELFELLEQFDIAAAHDTGRRHKLYKDDNIEVRAPDSFPMYNSGVVIFSDNIEIDNLFDKWEDIYYRHTDKASGIVNQPSFREALYKTDVRIATLPPEYNCRLPYPTYLRGEVKIIHGRTSNFEAIEQILNEEPTESRRTFLNFSGRKNPHILRLDLDKWQYRQRSLFESLFNRGIKETAIGLIRWYKGDNFWES
ncbi:hypothetical protein GCM10008995_02190 [Halobellus salinus]|uniref:Nucleotide-diphospho-sugar transferase domain-containing protein n=1 Tax=Halobellus salinus TaxID=931585 RepID=A0A830EC27_9EURY|nr:glycosyltransferase [Halobellus salinus]GGI95671.1 hypothetical protein GCM10008995_02190 [Halobellus salinus]SMP12482.1 Glycosyl transferase family 8 [Halobellus salinus]